MTENLDKDGLPKLPALADSTAGNGQMVDSLPGLARVAATAAINTTGWGLRTTARNWRRVGRAATNRDEAVQLIREVGSVVGTVGEIARQVADGVPVGTALLKAGEQLGGVVSGTTSRSSSDNDRVVDGEVIGERPTSLRERGQELLEKSRDVWATDDRHPAFDRILDDLAPDEARILVMLLKNGPQASVDIRTGGPVGMLSSQLIAPGLNMVGPRAGLRHLEQVPSYLNNLYRLGLVWFSRESLRDHLEYQVLEAQPDVLEAMHSVRFPKVVRRSIHLTPFGEEFVKQALVDEVTATSPALPEHDVPPDGDAD
ncbi:Abi-alpha family protein [Nocardioides bizhenqiangii]|uniref:Abi-alpha family protein n=1 Tax=Nocardioides bizhenqiangii TaxID=3095076 RepID=A0ABZ0ZQI2_9ACTN|nr:Abi-alpha family protein [Nocardioides sp. HM61]WQQ26104.1 Abi-alpha family protein [Nocardioides sp. HM61]